MDDCSYTFFGVDYFIWLLILFTILIIFAGVLSHSLHTDQQNMALIFCIMIVIITILIIILLLSIGFGVGLIIFFIVFVILLIFAFIAI